MLPNSAAPGSIPGILKYFSDKTIVDALDQHFQATVHFPLSSAYLEESGQWLENVDLNHRALVSGKLVQQKIWP